MPRRWPNAARKACTSVLEDQLSPTCLGLLRALYFPVGPRALTKWDNQRRQPKSHSTSEKSKQVNLVGPNVIPEACEHDMVTEKARPTAVVFESCHHNGDLAVDPMPPLDLSRHTDSRSGCPSPHEPTDPRLGDSWGDRDGDRDMARHHAPASESLLGSFAHNQMRRSNGTGSTWGHRSERSWFGQPGSANDTQGYSVSALQDQCVSFTFLSEGTAAQSLFESSYACEVNEDEDELGLSLESQYWTEFENTGKFYHWDSATGQTIWYPEGFD